MNRTVVTGAAGFLGSHLVDRLLADGSGVVGLDNLATGRSENLRHARRNAHFRFLRSDLTKTASLPVADEYYHLASPASPPAYQRDPIGTLWVNANGSRRVLEAARAQDAKVVLASTSEVYGDPEVHPQSEDYWGHVNPIGLRSCYDEGKRFSEALGMAFRRVHKTDVRVVRIFNTYGPRMDIHDGRVVSNFITQGITGKKLTVYGNGHQTRSFCYVDDTVAGIEAAMNVRSLPGPVNLGNPVEISVADLAGRISGLLGVPLNVRHSRLPEDDPRRRCPDISRARKWLGWAPRVPLRTGLVRTIRDFQERLRAPAGKDDS